MRAARCGDGKTAQSDRRRWAEVRAVRWQVGFSLDSADQAWLRCHTALWVQQEESQIMLTKPPRTRPEKGKSKRRKGTTNTRENSMIPEKSDCDLVVGPFLLNSCALSPLPLLSVVLSH